MASTAFNHGTLCQLVVAHDCDRMLMGLCAATGCDFAWCRSWNWVAVMTLSDCTEPDQMLSHVMPYDELS